jgi:hypothetical protein
MLLRGMHDGGCDDIYIIVTDVKRQEMDDMTAYFELVTEYSASRSRKNNVEQQIQHDCAFTLFSLLFHHSPHPPIINRYAPEIYSRETTPSSLFTPNRLDTPRDSL